MKGETDLRAAVLNRLQREQKATSQVSNESVRHAAHMLGVTPRQIRRLLARKEGQAPAVEPRFELTKHHIDVLFSVGGIASEAYKILEECGEKPSTSLKTFQRRVAQMDPALRATASHGWPGAISKFTYASKHAPYRGHTYCIDHTVLPVPVVAHRGSTEWFYPWGSIVWDEATRLALSGDAYDHDPQSETTRDILLAAFEGFDLDDGTPVGGVPENVLSDRGSDLISEMNSLGLIRAGIGRKFSPPRESYQNGIAEKGLDLFQKEFCRKQPGWVPGKRDSHQRNHPVDHLNPASLLTLDQFRALFAAELHRWNEARPHGSLGGQTPAQAWAADEHVVPAADPAALRMAMLKSDATPKIGKKGVRFNEQDYFHPTALRLHIGKTVEVRYLPRPARLHRGLLQRPAPVPRDPAQRPVRAGAGPDDRGPQGRQGGVHRALA